MLFVPVLMFFSVFEQGANPADFVVKLSGGKVSPGLAAGTGGIAFSARQLADMYEACGLAEVMRSYK